MIDVEVVHIQGKLYRLLSTDPNDLCTRMLEDETPKPTLYRSDASNT